jgi:methylated-DNA-[protein]-cysteine S-methyltransferase
MKYYDTIDTPMGSLLLLATEAGLCELDFNAKAREIEADWQHDPERLAPVVKQVGAYFAGELTDFDLPLDPQGTEFQQRVWRELCAIPFGETISYGELARRIGKPTASRAVGAANGQNPVAIIIPCHRVIGANGKLTGYAGGLDKKSFLLDHERRHDCRPLVLSP